MSFIASKDNINSNIIIFGCPFDSTSSFRPGSRFGPNAIRNVSELIETYSPVLDMDLEDIDFYDNGDLELVFGNTLKSLEIIERFAYEKVKYGKKLIGLGGEHLISYPIIKTYASFYKDLNVIHLDAHADLRDDYLGEKFSHATVMKRVSDIIGISRIHAFGIRSGTRDEFKTVNLYSKDGIIDFISSSDKPLYFTLDLDVLDPSILPATGTPEAGGISFKDLMDVIYSLKTKNIVGADIVELAPMYDNYTNSAAVAAKILRELILIMSL